jgi:tripeptidyl-peptidase-2
VEAQKYFHLLPSQTTVTSIRLYSGFTCEVDLARYWSAVGETTVEVQIEFRGFRPIPDVVHLTAGAGGECVRVFSDLKDDSIAPSAKLTKWKTPLRPKEDGVISPLGDRDVFPSTDKRIYQLVLTYEFTQEEAGSFTPRAPVLQGVLYESAYESQLMLIFDDDKKYLGVADAWPGEVKAPKGNVTVRVQVRHDDPEMLEKLKDMTIWIERKLEKDVQLSVYSCRESMLSGKNTMKKRTLRKGTSASVFFAEPPTSKIPSSCKAGDILVGTAYYGSGDSSLPGDGKRPGGFKVCYTVGPKPASKKSEAETPEAKDERTVDERVSEAVRDFRVEQLSKLTAAEKKDGKFDELYKSFEEMYPDYLPLLLARLKYIDTEENRAEVAPQVVEASDKVIGEISEDELALHFGKNYDKEDPVSCKVHYDLCRFLLTGESRWLVSMLCSLFPFTTGTQGDGEEEGNFD